jgi:hypothetical protein
VRLLCVYAVLRVLLFYWLIVRSMSPTDHVKDEETDKRPTSNKGL